MLSPKSIEQLQEMVTGHDCVLAVGGGTKSRLTAVSDHVQKITTRQLTGITEYEPSEYTFTALAGTPVTEIHAAVQAKGQFLPCSALLRESGATLGGAIASGLSGPGRFRFGGLRDFLLGIRYVSGTGKVITAGGKVVKNAAGFDLPKFMVGSLGRYGILTEVTFKVFPKPSALITLQVQCKSHEQAVERMVRAAASRWELYAIDYDASLKSLFLRLGGPAESIDGISSEIIQKWQGDANRLSDQEGDNYWEGIRQFREMPEGGLAVKVPLTPKMIQPLQRALESMEYVHAHYSVGGNVVGIMAPNVASILKVSDVLTTLGLKGMTFIGDAEAPLWLGRRQSTAIELALKQALDPMGRFPSLSGE